MRASRPVSRGEHSLLSASKQRGPDEFRARSAVAFAARVATPVFVLGLPATRSAASLLVTVAQVALQTEVLPRRLA